MINILLNIEIKQFMRVNETVNSCDTEYSGNPYAEQTWKKKDLQVNSVDLDFKDITAARTLIKS